MDIILNHNFKLNDMATRKVFIDVKGNEIAPYLNENNKLILKISCPEFEDSADHDIILPEEDAKEFIMELYRLRRKIG